MLLDISARAQYELPTETFILLMVEPLIKGDCHQVQEEKLFTSPIQKSGIWKDVYGNLQRRLVAPAGLFSFDFSARVEVEPNAALPDGLPEHSPVDIPPEVMIYTLQSRYCQSDELYRLAMSEFGHLELGSSRVNAIAQWMHEKMEYKYGTTDSMTDAFDVATSRVGVCRDFAHLTISFCRALGIPARYVSGYCLDLEPSDFHAWVQVYVGDQWHNVDATFDGTRPALVPIAIGRDAADVAMTTLFGTAQFLNQSVEVKRVENSGE